MTGGIRHATTYFPLVAALLAPLSTLLDIPALAQPWYLYEGKSVKDPQGCFVLSAVGLGFNALANGLLVLRFSGTKGYWKTATRLSVASWVIKTILAVANLAAYAARSRNQPGYSYSEGFWSAVASAIMAGLISIMLLFHFALQRSGHNAHGTNVRIAGKHFMMSIIAFLSLIALQAVIFSQIEGWTYFEGIYFSVVAALTVGFGDYEPTQVSTRILLFPFAVANIALLAVLVSSIINFLAGRTNKRKARMRAEFERSARAKTDKQHDTHLVHELSILQALAVKEVVYNRAFDLAASVIALVVFWTIAAGIFYAVEDWSYPTSLYFCYVFFLTIGFGDFSPTTPGGRVIFVIYALMAVPIVTSFVVQTVTSVVNTFAERQLERSQDRRNPSSGQELTVHSHAYHVQQSYKQLLAGKPPTSREPDHPVSPSSFTLATEPTPHIDEMSEHKLARLVLEMAVKLETQARTLLITTLGQGSKAQTLLLADQNVQMRTVRMIEERLKGSGGGGGKGEGAEAEVTEAEVTEAEVTEIEPAAGVGSDQDELEQVREYRKSFAAMLAVGSTLLKLEGDERWKFERRIEGEDEDFGGVLMGTGRKGPAEEKMGVDV